MLTSQFSLASDNEQPQNLNIAVASNFLTTLQQLKPLFERQYTKQGIQLKLISASTGQLSHQIMNGAPFDVFLSANKQHPHTLQKALKQPSAYLRPYALGQLVLIHQPEVNCQGRTIKECLTSEQVKKIAIANKKLAPYGLASEQVLQSLELDKTLKSKLITGQNISQSFQFFSTGNTQLAFVAASQVFQNDRIAQMQIKVIDKSLYEPIEQWALRLNDKAASQLFLDFLSTETACQVMLQNGYGCGP